MYNSKNMKHQAKQWRHERVVCRKKMLSGGLGWGKRCQVISELVIIKYDVNKERS